MQAEVSPLYKQGLFSQHAFEMFGLAMATVPSTARQKLGSWGDAPTRCSVWPHSMQAELNQAHHHQADSLVHTSSNTQNATSR